MKFILSKYNRPIIFLLDASGAFVSILLLFFLYMFEEYFGMPRNILAVFIGIASVLFLYSVTIYLINPLRWTIYLMIIALLNIGYCLFTCYHVFYYFETLTLFGQFYFVGEILVIVILSIYELRTATQTTKR
jgi:hypothetical protein